MPDRKLVCIAGGAKKPERITPEALGELIRRKIVTDDQKLIETLFGGGLIKATATPDGTVEVTLNRPNPEEVEDAASDLFLKWKDFRNLNVEGPCAIHDGKWWKALQWLALADSKMKDLFCGRDRSPRSIEMYHR